MKVFACVLALCLLAAVYCQNPAAAAAATAAAGGGQPLVGGAGMLGRGRNGGLGNFLTYGAMMGGLGGDSLRRFYMCNMLTGGTNNLLCLSSLMQ